MVFYVTNFVINDKGPSSRSILSAVNTPTYELAKFLVPILKSLTCDEYTVKLLNKILNFSWEPQMFILFLLTSLLKSLKNTKNSERVEGLSKVEFKNFYLLLQRNPILFLMKSSASKLMELLWVHLQVQHQPMFFLYTFKRIVYKSDFKPHYCWWYVHDNFFCLLYQSIQKPSEIF